MNEGNHGINTGGAIYLSPDEPDAFGRVRDTKRAYRFAKVKSRRKMAKQSRRKNR